MMAIIVLCRVRPPDHIINFYREFIGLGYAVYLLPDAGDSLQEIGGIQVISIDDADAFAAGYYDSSPSFKKPSRVVAWDKAFYYFNRINLQYDHVWFIEEDVFIPSAEIIQQIDLQHPSADLISRENIINTTGELESWYWWKYVPQDLLPLPWSRSLVCAARMSKRLLACIDQLVIASGHMLHVDTAPSRSQTFRAPFVEFLFHTIALAQGMKVTTPIELSNITWQRDWKLPEISSSRLTHPVKELWLHEEIRRQLIGGGSQSIAESTNGSASTTQ